MPDARGLPALGVLVDAADAMLPEVVRAMVRVEQRRAALSEELSWWRQVAAQDPEYARGYHAVAPVAGARDEDYLDRWREVSDGLWVLIGPRFRALDLTMPFAGVSGASRAITERDLEPLGNLARTEFAIFGPRYLALWSGLPADAWPRTRADSRLLAGQLGALRARPVPAQVSVCALEDLSVYEEYLGMYEEHRALRPEHRAQARPVTEALLGELIDAGTAWVVQIGGERAGLLAARPGVASGCRGVEVVSLLLAPRYCGHGYGASLSTLIARGVAAADDQWLFGTIHADNHPAYQAARGSGRIDIGGEILLDL